MTTHDDTTNDTADGDGYSDADALASRRRRRRLGRSLVALGALALAVGLLLVGRGLMAFAAGGSARASVGALEELSALGVRPPSAWAEPDAIEEDCAEATKLLATYLGEPVGDDSEGAPAGRSGDVEPGMVEMARLQQRTLAQVPAWYRALHEQRDEPAVREMLGSAPYTIAMSQAHALAGAGREASLPYLLTGWLTLLIPLGLWLWRLGASPVLLASLLLNSAFVCTTAQALLYVLG